MKPRGMRLLNISEKRSGDCGSLSPDIFGPHVKITTVDDSNVFTSKQGTDPWGSQRCSSVCSEGVIDGKFSDKQYLDGCGFCIFHLWAGKFAVFLVPVSLSVLFASPSI